MKSRNSSYDVNLTQGGLSVHTVKNGVTNPGFIATDDKDEAASPEIVKSDVDYTLCGYGSCKPEVLQRFHTQRFACVVLCFICFFQGFSVTGIIGICISTLERRFLLSSSQSAWIASSYDVAAGLTVLFVGYYGRTCHKARMLAVSALLLSIGSFVMSIPHFATGFYEPGEGDDICSAVKTKDDCSASDLQNYLVLFIIGQVLNGLGGTILYTLVPVYIDDNVAIVSNSLYLGVVYCASALGPACGYIIGGLFLDIYVDAGSMDTSSVQLSTNDPRWVGAWWIGFVLSGCILAILSTIMFCFGYELPAAAAIRKERIESKTEVDQLKEDKFGTSWKEMPKVTLSLFKNPIFMFILGTVVLISFVAGGFATFIAKYIQNQFSQTSSMSAYFSGGILVPGAAGSMLLGGVLVSKFKLNLLQIQKLCVISSFIAVLATSSLFIACDRVNFSGVNVAYGDSEKQISDVNLTSSCNQMCNCDLSSMRPVCGSDDVSYFSPCHAGCRSVYDQKGEYYYNNCTCIADISIKLSTNSSIAEKNICSNNCPLMPVFFVILLICVFCLLLTTTPSVTVTLKAVPESQRAYAVALQSIFSRFLGSLPGPLIFGVLIDQACIVWQYKCGSTGSCWMYDSFTMSLTWFILAVILNLCVLLFYLMAYIYIKRQSPKSDENCNNQDVKKEPDEWPSIDL